MLDQLGNNVSVGDLIVVTIGAVSFPCYVMKIQEGGIAMSGRMPQPGTNQIPVTPDKMWLQLEWAGLNPNVPPGAPQPGVFKIVAPPRKPQIVD